MNATTSVNGRDRKTLATQIERLDSMLDGLAENLNEAVATAVKEAVGIAVQQAIESILMEVLTNADLLNKLRGVIVPPVMNRAATMAPVPLPSLVTRLREQCSRTLNWLGRGLKAAGQSCLNGLQQAVEVVCRTGQKTFQAGVTCCEKARQWLALSWQRLQIIRLFKIQLLVAIGIGVTTGIMVLFASPWLATVVSAIGGFTTAIAVQLGLWVRRMMVMPTVVKA